MKAKSFLAFWLLFIAAVVGLCVGLGIVAVLDTETPWFNRWLKSF